jgi:hypothetical protein
MSKSFLFMSVAAVLVLTPALAQQKGESIWHIRGDNGETVQVLPGPAAAEAFEHRFARIEFQTRSNGYSVYSSSYGAVPGQLNDHGGAVVSNAAFQPIFYNAATAAALQAGIDGMINNFSNSDPGMKVVTQYSKTGNAISAALGHTADFVDNKSAPSRISDSGIQSYLTGLFNAHSVTPTTNTIYGVYLPSGTTSTNGSARSCTSYCGYHSSYSYNGMTILYAVFPYLS